MHNLQCTILDSHSETPLQAVWCSRLCGMLAVRCSDSVCLLRAGRAHPHWHQHMQRDTAIPAEHPQPCLEQTASLLPKLFVATAQVPLALTSTRPLTLTSTNISHLYGTVKLLQLEIERLLPAFNSLLASLRYSHSDQVTKRYATTLQTSYVQTNCGDCCLTNSSNCHTFPSKSSPSTHPIQRE